MTVPEYVYKECRKAGFTKEGCCALLGNMQHESAFVPNNVEDGRGWGDEAYTSHNTNRLDVDGVVKKIMGTDYVKEELEGRLHTVEA